MLNRDTDLRVARPHAPPLQDGLVHHRCLGGRSTERRQRHQTAGVHRLQDADPRGLCRAGLVTSQSIT